MGVYDMVSRVDVLHEICQEREGGGGGGNAALGTETRDL